jgi:hypothetical protein
MQGDRARRAYWRELGAGSTETLYGIANFIVWTGVGVEDYGEAVGRAWRRMQTVGYGTSAFLLPAYALNAGRPGDALETTDARGGGRRADLRDRLRQALWWDGDLQTAKAAAREVERSAAAPLASDVAALRSQYEDICAIGLWRALHREFAAARAAAERLGSAHITGVSGVDSASAEHFPRLCAALIHAARASCEEQSDARAQVERADSLTRDFIFEVCCGEAVPEANVLLARLWEHEGDLPRALAAVRRRTGGYMLAPLLLSTYLRQEGRLARLTGDTAGAVRAYRHYLALRSDPQPSLRPQRDSVLAELGGMESIGSGR